MDILNELFGVKDKTALITGGGRGIGESIAEAFVKAGARVYICSRRLETCEATAAQLKQFGFCEALACDIASSSDRQTLLAQYSERESSLDVLINNAGALWAAPLADYPEAGWDKVFDLNVKGLFFLIRDLTPLLSAAASHENPARIINIGSIDGFHVPHHETYAYPASKAAVHHLTRHLAAQLAASHITANVIAPGMFPSKMMNGTIAEKGMDEILRPVPLKRLTGPSDMAGAAIYLASRASAYVTGAVLPVDGGLATTL